jgi:hypothetical protein
MPINAMVSCGVVQVAMTGKSGGYLRVGKGHVNPLKAGKVLAYKHRKDSST